MAISQSKYIEITSGVSSAVVGERDFSGLVFTDADMETDAPLKARYDNGEILSLSLDDVVNSFTTGADVSKFCKTYFSYISPSGTSPDHIYVCKAGIEGKTDDATSALTYADENGGNFGSFTFVTEVTTISDTQLADTAEQNAGYNFKYLMCVGKARTASASSDVSAFDSIGKHSGLCKVVGNDNLGAAMPMAILAATDYTVANSATIYMFKQFGGVTPCVTNDADYKTYSDGYVNFYGQTKSHGTPIEFYQRGYNADGVDTAVYCNEMWFKSAIEMDFFNLVTRVEKIPANDTGSAMISNAIMGTVDMAITNGTILPGKILDANDRIAILQLSGNNPDAIENVAMFGYHYTISIVKGEGANVNDYIAKYRIIYSKGDGIRKVEGIHNLI